MDKGRDTETNTVPEILELGEGKSKEEVLGEDIDMFDEWKELPVNELFALFVS